LTSAPSKFRRFAFAAAGALCLIATSSPGIAQQTENGVDLRQFGPRVNRPPQQEQPAQQVKPDVMGTFGDWSVECQTASKAAIDQGAPAKACGMAFSVQDEKRKQIGLTIWLRKTKKDNKTMSTIQVIAPIGVYLPLGIAVEIDGNAAGRLPFFRCAPRFCLAFSEIVPTTLEKLRKGTSANFIIYEAPGVGVPLAVSLKGFTAAYDDLDKYD